MIGYLKNIITGGKKPNVSRADVLQSRPIRNPAIQWAREPRATGQTSVMVLRIPRRSDRLGNIVAKVMKLPDDRGLELDEIGSDVWEMCDGSTNVEAISRAISIQYRLNRRQAETSVTAYLKQLAERRLIAVRTGANAPRKAGSGSASSAGMTKKGTPPAANRRQKRA